MHDINRWPIRQKLIQSNHITTNLKTQKISKLKKTHVAITIRHENIKLPVILPDSVSSSTTFSKLEVSTF